MARATRFFFFIFSISHLFSCTQYLYKPGINLPAVREKNDFNVRGNVGLSSSNAGAAVAADFAKTEKLAFQAAANFSLGGFFNQKYLEKTEQLSGSGANLEAGIGFFKNMKNDNFEQENITLMGFAGGGLGFFQTKFAPQIGLAKTQNTMRAVFGQTWVQPVAILRSRFFEIGLGCRVGWLQFFGGSFSGNDLYFLREYQFLKNQNGMVALEPSLCFRAGFGKYKINLQANATSVPQEISSNSLISAGVQYFFEKKGKTARPTLPISEKYFRPVKFHQVKNPPPPLPVFSQKKQFWCKKIK